MDQHKDQHKDNLFKWRHYKGEVILLCVRWYLRYSLSYRDIAEMMAERGVRVDHTTIYRWVQHYGPQLAHYVRCSLKPTNNSWRIDETYIRVHSRGAGMYLYRAVDSDGNTLDFMLSYVRDTWAASHFLSQLLKLASTHDQLRSHGSHGSHGPTEHQPEHQSEYQNGCQHEYQDRYQDRCHDEYQPEGENIHQQRSSNCDNNRATPQSVATPENEVSPGSARSCSTAPYPYPYPYPYLTTPRVINVDKNPTYQLAFDALQALGEVPEGCQLRPVKYLNNILEQDHRFIKRRVRAGLCFKGFLSAWPTIQGYEAMHLLRKGQVEGTSRGDVLSQNRFLAHSFGLD
jgi:transposase, IS6 family